MVRTRQNPYPCPVCQIPVRGMMEHVRMMHPAPEDTPPAKPQAQAVGGTSGAASSGTSEEGEKAVCDGCDRREDKIQDLKAALAETKAEREKAVGQAQAQVNDVGKALADARQEAEKLRAADLPPLSALIAHCEGDGCRPHAQEWNEIKTRIVAAAYEAVPQSVVAQKAEEYGLIPKKITVHLP